MLLQLPARRVEILADSLPDGSAVLYDPRDEMIYAISNTGAHIWNACDGSRRLPELASLLAAEFAIAAEDIQEEVAAFVDHLQSLDLIEQQPLGDGLMAR